MSYPNSVLQGLRFQASAAAALAVSILALGYLGSRNPSPIRDSPAEKLSIAVPMTPHAALLHIAAAKGYFDEEGLAVTMMPAIHGKAAIDLVVQGTSAAKGPVPNFLSHLYLDALLAVQPERVMALH